MSEQVIGFEGEGLDSGLLNEWSLTDSVGIPPQRVEPSENPIELERLLIWRSKFCRTPRSILDELGYQRRRYEKAAEILARIRANASDAGAVVAAVSSVYDFATAPVAHSPVESETGVSLQHSAQYCKSRTEHASTLGGVHDRHEDHNSLYV